MSKGNVDKVCGPYMEKEEEAKFTSLVLRRRLNHVCDAMEVECNNRHVLVEQKYDEMEGAKVKKPQKSKRAKKGCWQAKISRVRYSS